MKQSSRGFTIVELLVVMAVVMLGLALLTPAVSRATNEDRRIACTFNLKNIGLGLFSYHSVNRAFPPGWVADSRSPHTGPRFGWQTALLPYMDSAAMYRRIIRLPSMPAAGDEGPTNTSLEFYRCPADYTGEFNPMRGGYPTSNYSGNFGSDPLPRWVPGRRAKQWPGQVATPRQANGVFWCNSHVAIRDIRDGASNTLLVGERSLTSGAGIWPGVGDNLFENDQVTDCSHLSPINNGSRGYSGLHDKGVCFVFCDGSARLINANVESLPTGGKLGVYQRLANRGDGMEIPANDFQ